LWIVYMCETVYNSSSHMVDAIRMQMEVQRRLHEQLEVSNFQTAQLIYFSLSLHKICTSLPWAYTPKKTRSFLASLNCRKSVNKRQEKFLGVYLLAF
jgi:hypothetical protein